MGVGAAPDMPGLREAHLILLSLWGGVVLAEAVIELLPRRHPVMRHASVTLHLWIDLLIELPLVAGVVLTGMRLLAGRPWGLLLEMKVWAGCAAIAANLACITLVVWRAWAQNRRAGARRIVRLSRAILASAAIGLPFAATAAVLGFLLSGVGRPIP